MTCPGKQTLTQASEKRHKACALSENRHGAASTFSHSCTLARADLSHRRDSQGPPDGYRNGPSSLPLRGLNTQLRLQSTAHAVLACVCSALLGFTSAAPWRGGRPCAFANQVPFSASVESRSRATELK